MNMNAAPRSSQGSGPTRKPHVTSAIERLEYRTAGSGADSAFPGNSSHGLQSLVEEWLHPATAESTKTIPAADGFSPHLLAERRWQEERAALEAELTVQRNAASHAIAAARAEGSREGSQSAEAALQEERKRLQQQVADALQNFLQERDRYFHSVEREVVRLALAIAARVLHREAQMDPLLLSGAVRVVLDQLVDTSETNLRVAPTQLEAWGQFFLQQGTHRLQPKIVADISLEDGDCVLETRLGTVELGVSAQLEEIEKGFFDLLQHRPAYDRGGREEKPFSAPSHANANVGR